MQSPSSTDASLSLLKETVAYLRRLPANPATTEMIRKIDSYLAGAGNEAAYMSRPEAMEGRATTSFGLVLLSVLVEAGRVSLVAPVMGRGSSALREAEVLGEQRSHSSAPGVEAEVKEGAPFDDNDVPLGEYAGDSLDTRLDRVRLQKLHQGLTVDLAPAGFPSTHASLVEASKSNLITWR